jgi:cytochrome o ubiquinol oxidase subunit II
MSSSGFVLGQALRRLAGVGLVAAAACAAGCNMVVLDPAGDVAAQQGRLVVAATVLMLLIVVPVIALTLLFAWRYRESNPQARYDPHWDHSLQLELVIWAAPLLIIIALGALTWIGTHTLDPYRPLARIGANRPIPEGVKPLNVDVVALDWKWLFVYPDHGVAVVNEMAAPVDVPIRFRITASSVMNSFFVPALAGQIYAMPGMETRLHAVINKPGNYEGFSGNYSGAGFSHMRFKFRGMSAVDFERWLQSAKDGGGELSRNTYLQLEKPSERHPVQRFAAVAPGLYDAIVNRCVEPGTMCMRHAAGSGSGLSFEGEPLRLAAAGRTRPNFEAEMCTADEPVAAAAPFTPVTRN